VEEFTFCSHVLAIRGKLLEIMAELVEEVEIVGQLKKAV
jgi:hypothetical protein